jgi:hypothetical protein
LQPAVLFFQYSHVGKYYEKVRVGGHIELSNDNSISEKFRNENDVIYEVDAFVNVVLRKV